MIDKGANIEAKTKDDLTPLHCAARSGRAEIVDFLVEHNVNIASRTKVIYKKLYSMFKVVKRGLKQADSFIM